MSQLEIFTIYITQEMREYFEEAQLEITVLKQDNSTYQIIIKGGVLKEKYKKLGRKRAINSIIKKASLTWKAKESQIIKDLVVEEVKNG